LQDPVGPSELSLARAATGSPHAARRVAAGGSSLTGSSGGRRDARERIRDRRPLRVAGALRRSVRSWAVAFALSVRARARREPRPRPGDDRPQIALRAPGAYHRLPRASRLYPGLSRIPVDAATRRGPEVAWADGAYPQSTRGASREAGVALCLGAASRDRACGTGRS